MNEVFQQGTQQLEKISLRRSIKLRIREYLWRFVRAGWPPISWLFFGIAPVFWLIWLSGFVGLLDLGLKKAAPGSGGVQLVSISSAAQSLSAIIVLIITIWGAILGISRSLMLGSARGTNKFMESIRDPMRTFTTNFKNMISQIGQPTAIFIDDLDRCQGSYVVELLEGVQTVFHDAPVTYVVAADHGWICASYEKVYDTFNL